MVKLPRVIYLDLLDSHWLVLPFFLKFFIWLIGDIFISHEHKLKGRVDKGKLGVLYAGVAKWSNAQDSKSCLLVSSEVRILSPA